MARQPFFDVENPKEAPNRSRLGRPTTGQTQAARAACGIGAHTGVCVPAGIGRKP
jgi:hypothetical protein